MLIHKKSRAIFEETPLGGNYYLEGKNIEGTFRVSADFINEFEVIYSDIVDFPELTRKEITSWRRSLVYYIGKGRELQRKRKRELSEARQKKVEEIGGINYRDMVVRGNTIYNLNLRYHKVEEYTFSKLNMDKQLSDSHLSTRVANLFAGYGRLEQWGHFNNLEGKPFFFNFENGVQVRLVIDRKYLGMEDEPIAEPKPKLKQKKTTSDDIVRAKKESKLEKAARDSGQDTKDMVDISYLAEALKLPATKVRGKLRKMMAKPEGGWTFTKSDADKLIANW